jgi:hypothetical protein
MKARGLLGVLTCALALAAPGAATAKPGYYVSPSFRDAKIQVKASHGYHVVIYAFLTNVEIKVENGDREVTYGVSNGAFRRDRIWARLPGVGWINLRFHERKRYRQPLLDNCKGHRELIRVGTFEGRIRIRGESGYTQLDRRRVSGKIESSFKQTCSQRQARASSKDEEVTLITAAPRGAGTVSFEANRWPPFAGSTPIFFSARLFRKRAGMVIVNSVDAYSEDLRLMKIDDSPLSALVDPPGLFSGSAEFLQAPDDFTWLGDLTTDLPGIGPVDLSGPHFEALLCLGRHCRGDEKLKSSVYPFFTALRPRADGGGSE